MQKLSNIVLALALTSAIGAASPHSGVVSHPQSQEMAMDMKAIATTSSFSGIEVNGGTASLYKMDGVYHLKVSDDFKIPGTPSPHWQVVDEQGNVYLLSRFTVKDDKTHRHIMLPKYIRSVAKVQVWCSFAEVLLGEAKFPKAQSLR